MNRARISYPRRMNKSSQNTEPTVDTRELAHRFEKDIREYIKTANVSRNCGVHICEKGLVGQKIIKDPFCDESLKILADNYSQGHNGYGELGRKCFLDGASFILSVINEILER